jgi:hypothetical protein
MTFLGELHENESISTLWDQERTSMSDALLQAIPPIIQEQAVPSCPKPRIWSILWEIIKDPLNRHHHNKSRLVPSLARHQMAKMVAVIMTIHPMPALARHQTAKGSATIAMQPHLKGHHNASEFQPCSRNPLCREGNPNKWQ